MLSKVVKEKIEARYRQKVLYARHCDALAAHVSEVCKCPISASTLKRLWGFIKKDKETRPREWTLDLLSQYCGYASWADWQNELAGNTHKKKNRIESVNCLQLKGSATLRVCLGRFSFFELRCEGKGCFQVINANKTLLCLNDQVEIENIRLDHPILIKRLTRNGVTSTDLIVGDLTGVTDINLAEITGKPKGVLTTKK